MSYINVGAYVNGTRPKTKTALKSALKEDPTSVTFDSTSPLGPRAGESIQPATIGTDKLSVVGPDPYRDRRWYATVSINPAGKITIS